MVERPVRGTLLFTALIGVYLLPGVLERSGDQTVLPYLMGEDGVYETVGALSCLAASILFAGLWVYVPLPNEMRQVFGRRNVLFGALAIGLFLVFGEEMNWGERLIFSTPPRWVYGWNDGGEIALHLIGHSLVPLIISGVSAAMALAYLSLVPALCRLSQGVRRLAVRWDAPVASGTLAWTTLTLFLLGIFQIGACHSGHFHSEQFEAALQVLFLIFAGQQVWMRRNHLPTAAFAKIGLATLLTVLPVAIAMGSLLFGTLRVPANYAFLCALYRSRSAITPEVEEYLERCLEHQPDHVGALCLSAGILKERGDWKEVESRLLVAVDRAPDNPLVQSAMAELRYRQGRPHEAIEHLQRTLALTPGNFELRLIAISHLQEAGRSDEAQIHIQYLRRHLPRDHELRRHQLFQ